MLCEITHDYIDLALNQVLILVLMEDALRELILRRVECQLVTTLFSENPLDFRGKSVPNRLQIYEFSRLCLTISERSHRADALYYIQRAHLPLYSSLVANV